MAKKKTTKKKKTAKKRTSTYKSKLKIIGSFDDVLKVSLPKSNKDK